MSDERLIPVRAIWLRRERNHAVVLIEQEPGKWVEVIREFCGDGPFSHICERSGIEKRLQAANAP